MYSFFIELFSISQKNKNKFNHQCSIQIILWAWFHENLGSYYILYKYWKNF